MQEIEKELKRIEKKTARLSKEGQKLTEQEMAIRESLSFEHSYQEDNGEVDIQRAKDLIKNLQKHIAIIRKQNVLNTMRSSLLEQKTQTGLNLLKGDIEAEVTDDREAQSMEADSAKDTN